MLPRRLRCILPAFIMNPMRTIASNILGTLTPEAIRLASKVQRVTFIAFLVCGLPVLSGGRVRVAGAPVLSGDFASL